MCSADDRPSYSRVERTANSRAASFVVALTVALAMVSTLAHEALASTPPPCRVKDPTSGVVYRGRGSNLQVAINVAGPGSLLLIRGTCVGNFRITNDLKLKGDHGVTDAATLDGGGTGTVVTIQGRSTRVSLINLTVTNGIGKGSSEQAGGINNSGILTLTDSVVSRNRVRGGRGRISGGGQYDGGGVYNLGSLTMNGSTSVTGNIARIGGGGIANNGILTMNDSSRVARNTGDDGGGITIFHGTVTMRGHSSVRGNHSRGPGGGITKFQGKLKMTGHSSVAANVAQLAGGGIANFGGGAMNDDSLIMKNSSSVTGNLAFDNGGGIYGDRPVTMNDSSSVTGNHSRGSGGGIANGWTLTLRGSASVTGNTADETGGGVYNESIFRVCSTWTGAISPNTPDDPPTWIARSC